MTSLSISSSAPGPAHVSLATCTWRDISLARSGHERDDEHVSVCQRPPALCLASDSHSLSSLSESRLSA